MINVSVHYPRSAGSHFDMDYYQQKHIPLVRQRYGAALAGLTILHAVRGGADDEPAPHIASAHFTFESVDIFTAAFTPHMEEILEDIKKFTDIAPVLEVSEILLRDGY